jgi:signal transduction histidine kinase/HAMP domain-containing protein
MTKPTSAPALRARFAALADWPSRLIARIPATVHAKLIVSFLAVAGLLIALGAVGLETLSRVNRGAEELVKRQQRIVAYRQFQRDTALAPSWSWNDRTLAATLRRFNEFRYDLDQLQFVAMGDGAPLAELRADYDQFTEVVARTVDLLRAEDAVAAAELLRTRANPLATRLEHRINDLVNQAEADMVASLDASQGAYLASQRIVILFSAGSIVLALILGYTVSRAIINPVTLMGERLRRVASRDFAQRFEVPNRDELGDLVAQFNRMAGQLQESYARLEDQTRALSEALDQQTATSEILRVIAGSPGDLQPVFDAVARSAATLCDAQFCAVCRFDGEVLHLVAHHNLSPEGLAIWNREFPTRPGRGSAIGRAVLDLAVVQIPDVMTQERYRYRDVATVVGYRGVAAVPLVREGRAVGGLVLARARPGLLPEKQVEMLQTFAHQAAIAIGNARLFKELESRNRELSEALEQQTATSEILRVISGSPTEIEPVFDAIARSALRLCDGAFSVVTRLDGDLIHLAAHAAASDQAIDALRRLFPTRPSRSIANGRSILENKVIHLPDVRTDPEYDLSIAQALGNRSSLAVPMLRDGRPIGAIFVGRTQVRPFSDKEIALLQTFADQAVIAIENVRLFHELQARTTELARSVGELEALGEVGQAVSSTLDLQTVLSTIVSHAVQLSGADGGAIYEHDDATGELALRATRDFDEALPSVRPGEGAVGRAAARHEPVAITDVLEDQSYPVRMRELSIRSGFRASLAVPLLREDRMLGSLVVVRRTSGTFPSATIELLRTFAAQSALAIQNARLFREVEEKNRQVVIANRHKSEFLANMSHELRTPLNAIIGFSEVLHERMFGELNDKQAEYVDDIHSSGQHLLSLINDILDLSKIEAGRMELHRSRFHLPAALNNAVLLVRERAARHGIELKSDIDPRLGEIQADELRFKQILLNLLSNALKFTPPGGRVTVSARKTPTGTRIAVADTGIGIPADQQQAIFEEFRQVGGDSSGRREGTGLGLTLTRKFVELHGGVIRVQSAPGTGSTFAIELPDDYPELAAETT